MVLVSACAIADLHKQLSDSLFAAPHSALLEITGEQEVRRCANEVSTCRQGGWAGDDKCEVVDSCRTWNFDHLLKRKTSEGITFNTRTHQIIEVHISLSSPGR